MCVHVCNPVFSFSKVFNSIYILVLFTLSELYYSELVQIKQFLLLLHIKNTQLVKHK